MNHTTKTTIKLLLAAVLTVIFTHSLHSQFLKTYNMTAGSIECGRSIELSALNTFTISGYSNSSPNAGNYDWMFQKMDFSGNVLGNVVFGFPNADSCFSHAKLGSTTNNVMAGFYTNTWKSYTRDIASWTIVDETTLNHIASKMVIDSFRSQYRCVVKGRQGTDFVLTGFSQAAVTGFGLKNKILAGLYDAAGNKIWLNRYSTSPLRQEAGSSICYSSFDSTYTVTGVVVDSSASGNIKKVFVMKLTTAGVPVWYKTYTPITSGFSHNKSESRRIIAMPNGDFVIAGWTEEPNSPQGNLNIWVFRINSSGSLVWSNTYGAFNITEQGFAIQRNFGGTELVLTGFTTRYGTEDLLNLKIDGNGNLLWARSKINGTGQDRGYDVDFLPKMIFSNAYYWFTGQYHKTPFTNLNSYLMKTMLNGHIVPNAGCTDTVNISRIQTITRIDTFQVSRSALNDVSITPARLVKKLKQDTVCQVSVNPITPETDNSGNIQPVKYSLEQNYPNPFNPSTKINFSLAADGDVSLRVFDITGREVAVIVNEFRTAGNYLVEFNASSLPSGVYLCKLSSGSFEETKKMLLVK